MRDVWLQLAHVGMHPDRMRVLVEAAGSPVEVLRAIQRGNVTVPDQARAAATVSADRRAASLADTQVTFLTRDDEDFPSRLRELPDSPYFLFQRGASLKRRAVAVVGTRACTGYGRRLANRYGAALSNVGWSVVSGLARGIDAAAHRGSLSGPTPGVAVLGSGIDVWYPREHRSIGDDLLASGGTIWSESGLGTPPLGWRFPPRNRIISGIAEAVVVVEAGVKGGALITARTALEQGREVCATPGDVGRESSVGCNLLIRDGALPVHDESDLIACLDLVVGNPKPDAVANPSDGFVGECTIAEFLLTLDTDPAKALAEMGRQEDDGRIEIRGGIVCKGPSKSAEVQGE